MTEADIQRAILIEATTLGHRLFRNQIGRAAYKNKGGVSTVPYGVGGVGGADLIGWTKKTLYCYPDPIEGEVEIAVFTAVEIKGPKGRVTKEQENFLEAVRKAGGLAAVCRSVDDYRKLVGADLTPPP